MNDSRVNSTVGRLNEIALSSCKHLGISSPNGVLSDVQRAAEACLRALMAANQNIPVKKEYAAKSRTARKRNTPSHGLHDISVELSDFGKALAPRGRFRRRSLSFESVSALLGDLPSGEHLIVSETRQVRKSTRDELAMTRKKAKVTRRRVHHIALVACDYSNLVDQLDYLNSLRSRSGEPLQNSFYEFLNEVPPSFQELVSSRWEHTPNSNIAVKDIQNALTATERIQLAKAARWASLAVGLSAQTNISVFDWKAASPIFQMIRSIIEAVWPTERGLPKRTNRKNAKSPSERNCIIDLVQAALDYVEEERSHQMPAGRLIGKQRGILGGADSTRDDLSILVGYVLNLRFDIGLLRAYRILIDDYILFWDAATERHLHKADNEGRRSSSRANTLSPFELSYIFSSNTAHHLSNLQGQMERLLHFGSNRPDVPKHTIVGEVGPGLRMHFEQRPRTIEWRRGWRLHDIPVPDEAFLAEIIQIGTSDNERALQAWKSMQASRPLSLYLAEIDRVDAKP